MKVNNRNYKKFKKQVQALGKMKIQIGATGQHANTTLTNAELLAIHEDGTNDGHIPGRHAIRKTFKDKKNLRILNKNLNALLKKHFKPGRGFDLDKIGEGIGETMRSQLVAFIKRRQLNFPNAESTLRQKKGDVPLIVTLQMVNSIAFAVKKK